MSALDKARKRARQALESQYEGRCTVVEYQDVENPVTFITESKLVEAIKDQPCKLSYSSLPAVSQTDTFAGVNQSIKLFIAPEVEIKPGSIISVMQNGRETIYKNSGQPAIYFTHQEINLELNKDKA